MLLLRSLPQHIPRRAGADGARGTPLFAISALGFATNQVAYLLLLQLSGLRYDLALALVLAGVAVMTYLLGRRWAFQPAPR